ncbi:hypothetical protein ABKN59_010864 [Abortiporus biennis]
MLQPLKKSALLISITHTELICELILTAKLGDKVELLIRTRRIIILKVCQRDPHGYDHAASNRIITELLRVTRSPPDELLIE